MRPAPTLLCLSYRDVEELLFARGILVTYEAIRKWCRKFGQPYAHQLRRRRPQPGDKWHLDEVFLTIHGERHYLWRAVDQDGNILDILVQRRRDKHAAKKFFRKLLKGSAYVPRVLITDKLKSYGAAKRDIANIAISTTAPRILTSRHASGSGACRGLRHRVTPSDSSPPMVPSPNTSARDATGSPPSSIAKRWPNDSRSGRKSRARSWLPMGRVRGSLPTSLSKDSVNANKLTTPMNDIDSEGSINGSKHGLSRGEVLSNQDLKQWLLVRFERPPCFPTQSHTDVLTMNPKVFYMAYRHSPDSLPAGQPRHPAHIVRLAMIRAHRSGQRWSGVAKLGKVST